ncbi:Protein N-acetyltransferase, RimJ/RimL family [Proteiniclasticum ruminis]|uniref:Protein N-acetyltransferase, RimJ/RimL family n=1 Tax=Proteiniclasticum ruminis TaxID=398199 RepID=A0A1G8NK77_9CLOT|nr:Protein N-acetyltransferase, RimJ/RimL family [Proteiniclasticum ruminis]
MISLRQDIFMEDALKIADWLEDQEIIAHLNEDTQMSRQIRSLVETSRMPLYNQVFNQKGLFYLICLKDEAIGYVTFIPKANAHEIVITIGEKELWGKGYGKSALKKALCEAFFSLRTQKINAKIKHLNKRSLSLFEHFGFEGDMVKQDLYLLSMDFDTFLKKAA